MKCKFCGQSEAVDGKKLCAGCLDIRQYYLDNPERLRKMKEAAKSMADDMLDEKFGPEAGTTLN